MEIDVQPNWANDPRAYGLADGLAEWADDPRAYGLRSPNLELGFPDDLLDPHDLVQLDGPSNSTTGTAPEQPNNHSEDVSENPADLPATQPAIDVKPEEHLPVPSGSNTDRQDNEESSNGPPPSQPFPLSPPTVPVVLDCFDIPSPAPSSDDEDLPDAAQLLSQLFRPKRNSKETVKDEPSKDEDDDIQILDGDPTSSAPRSAKSLGKQRAEVPPSALAGPGPTTQLNLKRKYAEFAPSLPADFLKSRWHDEFVYLDGSVIIQINSTRFKLHRTSLVEHSLWFKERFGSERNPDELCGEPLKSIPVYILDGVVEEADFVNLLVAVREAITYIDNPPDLYTLISILRASHKLGFTRFKFWATRLLEKMWPAELDPISTTAPVDATSLNLDKTCLSTRLSPIDATAVVSLARECGIQSVLKRSLYELIRSEGFGHLTNQIPDSDRNLLISAREKLTQLWMELQFPPSPSFPECPLLAAGPAAPTNASPPPPPDDIAYDPPAPLPLSIAYLYDPLSGLEKLAQLNWEGLSVPAGGAGLGSGRTPGLGYCPTCARARREFFASLRMEWWEIFGNVFGC
ncbi:hypothetical protein BT96DRAFT_918523 [Gymnopus androsaceus JB14]|uniref:BTB domain-containing protein n=1 Tax=Gymnopus androsaceus JB14 TaxID=1447944 RepID=A0A6A4HSC2_9AGAR|nr:hypothetical protein BT96DRAFT_918523 [Gymnopus androsaceus JB14]